MNDTNINESVPLPFGQVEIITGSATIFPLFVFGFFGNVVTMAGVLQSQALKSSMYFLLMSLCASDLISALISPLALYRLTWGYEYWYWSNWLCKIFWGADIATSIATAVHILMFSILRFVSVKWPQKFELFTLRRTKIFITIVWIGSLVGVFVPALIFFGAIRRDRKDPAPSSQWASCGLLPDKVGVARLYAGFLYVFFVYIPMILTAVFSMATSIQIVIARKRRERLLGEHCKRNRATTKRRRKEKKILLQLGLVVGSFLLGYIPRTAYHIYTLSLPPAVGSGSYNWWFAFIEYLLLRVSECLNPVFYNLSSKKMRRATFAVLRVARMKFGRKDEVVSESTNSKFNSSTTQNISMSVLSRN